jgi:hypothetical protein
LAGVHVERTFGPNEVIGFGDFLFYGHLGANPLLDLFGGPTASAQSPALGGRGTGHADYSVKICFGVSLVKQRNDYRGDRA